MRKMLMLGVFGFVLCGVLPSYAGDKISTKTAERAGFVEMAKMSNNTSSAAKEGVNKQAARIKKDLGRVSESDKKRAQKRLRDMARSLGVKDYDVSSVNTRRKGGADGVKRNVRAFRKDRKRKKKAE